MQRYFLPDSAIRDHQARLSGNDFHHVFRVMRMKPGDRLFVNDASGHAWIGEIEAFEGETALVRLLEEAPGHPSLPVTIAQGLIKRDAMELMIEKAAEFGAEAVLPTAFLRSVVKIEDDETARKKTERYGKIAKEASEQCHRAKALRVYPPLSLRDLPYGDYDRVWVCYEASGPGETLREAVKKASPAERILVLVGPEGGIDPSEIAFLKTKNAEIVDLGERILRAETASLYLLSVLSFLWEGSR